MGYISPKGRDWSAVVNFDDLAKFYCALAVAWTVLLLGGMAWLVLHRHLQFLRIRNLTLAIAATSMLHVYLIKILLAYTVNGHFPCSIEFWIMSIYLPMGIALFQANMLQLQSVNGQQQKILQGDTSSVRALVIQSERGMRGRWNRFFAQTVAKRTEMLIAAGMVAQVLVTTAIFLASRKFHGSWGTESQATTPAKCRKGWEWIPSTIWQLVFSWVYGPYILYRIRNIHDIHHWRLQTTLCVISGLPGAPMWLAAVYSTSFKSINRYWVPPMWLAPGIITMQAVTIFFPIFEAYKSRAQLRSTMEIIKAWEDNKQSNGSVTDYSGTTRQNSVFSAWKTPASSNSTPSTTSNGRRKELYTMAALEKALAMNPIPLLHFAATKEFSGENIRFLMHIRDWHQAWSRFYHQDVKTTATDDHVRRHLFDMAVQVYTANISSKTAEFPVNIEGRIRSELDQMFAPAVADLQLQLYDFDNDVVDPFNRDSHTPFPSDGDDHFGLSPAKSSFQQLISRDTSVMYSANDSADTLKKSGSRETMSSPPSPGGVMVVPTTAPTSVVPIPEGFDEHVFDAVEHSVKYMVITNTWPKFVASRQDGDW